MKTVILYSMEGCPHCYSLKKMFKEENLEYIERNVDEHEKEYKQFVDVTKNEYLPALTLVEIKEGEKPDIQLLAPDLSFKDLNEAIHKVKEFLYSRTISEVLSLTFQQGDTPVMSFSKSYLSKDKCFFT